jgi:hypothetical protein
MAIKVSLLFFSISLKFETYTEELQTLSAKNAAALDKDLMSIGAFSIDQLMELAGLSVSQAGSKPYPFHPYHFLRKISLQSSPSKQGKENFGCLWAGK